MSLNVAEVQSEKIQIAAQNDDPNWHSVRVGVINTTSHTFNTC